ncbi:MAG TPA: hypothetical protein VFQ39_00465 [Longimicrobium sp.]|nr:hypothetical protein [Longimicrobium sp.]
MSLAAFQRAFADMAARPELCAAVLDDAGAALAGYDLTPIEIERLASAADQRGMRLNCTMYRNNRLSPLVSQLPRTFHLLGRGLREVAEGFWAENPRLPRSVPPELRRFAAFVRRRIAEGAITEPLLLEVLDWETETYELALLPPERTLASVAEAAAAARADRPLRPHPLVGTARFTREPFGLMRAMAEKRVPPYPELEEGEFFVLIDFRGPTRAFHPLDAATAAAFRALKAGAALSYGDAARLVELGMAVAAEEAPAEVAEEAAEAIAA